MRKWGFPIEDILCGVWRTNPPTYITVYTVRFDMYGGYAGKGGVLLKCPGNI